VTAYEQITRKIEDLDGAAERCFRNGRARMAWVWRMKRNQLEEKRQAMTVGQAEARA
jgi:hypothetical protein